MKIVTYQIGVDILGFPIYVEHQIFRGSTIDPFRPTKKSFWVTVIEKIIKQH